jgi:hypothetical protein
MENSGFTDDRRNSARDFYGQARDGEINDAPLRRYLQLAPQIEEVWQQVQGHVEARVAQGIAVWNAYAEVGYALACIRTARAYLVLVSKLLNAAANPHTAGYLPRVTYEQANALCQHISPNLQRAMHALNKPEFVPDVVLPLHLGPHLEAHNYPLTHLQGMIAATAEIRAWATALLAHYDNAINAAPTPVPATITAHRSALQSVLAEADSHLRFGVDLVGQIAQGNTPPQTDEEAEMSLWNALQNFLLLNQAIAAPEALHRQ